MKFNSVKKGRCDQLTKEDFIKMKSDYEEELSRQKDRIFSLKNALVEKEKEVERYKKRETAISSALVSATEKAEQIERLAVVRYQNEMASLKAFREKWQAHYEELARKIQTPTDLDAEREFEKAMDEILQGDRAKIAEIEVQFEKEWDRLMRSEEQGSTLKEGSFQFFDFNSVMKDLGLAPNE